MYHTFWLRAVLVRHTFISVAQPAFDDEDGEVAEYSYSPEALLCVARASRAASGGDGNAVVDEVRVVDGQPRSRRELLLRCGGDASGASAQWALGP